MAPLPAKGVLTHVDTFGTIARILPDAWPGGERE